MKTKLISAWNSVKYGKNGWTNAGDIFRCHKNQIHSLQHQQLSFFKGKASQRTRQFGFLASPITESWSLDLLTLNRGALSEIRSDPSYHHSDHIEDHYFQYLKPVSEIKYWIKPSSNRSLRLPRLTLALKPLRRTTGVRCGATQCQHLCCNDCSPIQHMMP